MQAKDLVAVTGGSEPILKEWLRKRVIIPAKPGQGPGVHADYDPANVLAMALAVRMKGCAVVVTKYAEAFRGFQAWLRGRSAIEWPQYIAVLSPTCATMVRSGQLDGSTLPAAFVAPLEPICRELAISFPAVPGKQIPLLGLETVGRSRASGGRS